MIMIGIFDSGIGGMTVARAVEQLLPELPLVYYGDIARTPYGSKSAATIINYSLENTEFLLKQGAELIIIACNSASSVATEALRQEFKVPIIEVISPAAAEAVRQSRSGRIGIIGTRATIRSGVYEQTIRELAPDSQVVTQACPLLVPLVEEGWTNRQETKMIIRRYLHPLKDQQIDTLILGCTHYPVLKELIQHRIGRRVSLIDSSIETAKALQRFLAHKPDLIKSTGSPPNHSYFVSDLTDAAQAMARKIFQRPVELRLA